MNEPGGVDPRQVVRVSSPTHRVRVIAEQRDDVAIEGKATARQVGATLSVDGVRGAIRVRVPIGSDVQVGTDSSRVEVHGAVGHLAIVTSSGRVEAETAETADIRTASGRVEMGSVNGEACIRSTSGRVHVGACDGLDVATETGRIEVHEARGPVQVHCVNGRVEVEMARPADVDAETVTGRIEVALPPGTKVFRPAEGEGPGDRPLNHDCTVTARSVSGRVVVSTT